MAIPDEPTIKVGDSGALIEGSGGEPRWVELTENAPLGSDTAGDQILRDGDGEAMIAFDDSTGHAHTGAAGNGTVVAHSSTSGRTANDHHDQIHGSAHADNGADPIVSGATVIQYISTVVKATVNYNSSSPVALFTVQDGDVVKCIFVEVTTTWDGNGTVDIGDGDDTAGFLPDGSIDKGTAGYYPPDPASYGSYIYLPAGRACYKIYTTGDTIDATVVTGTSTQGSMTVYILLTRLK